MDFWLNACNRAQIQNNNYSEDFIQTFENSEFFTTCKKSVEGKFQWREWGACSVNCGGGIQTKIATSCLPNYAVCYGIQVLERTCNNQACPIGQWIWSNWSECTNSCGGGVRIKTAEQCSPEGAFCGEVPIMKEACNENACSQGQWNWNPWSDCSVSCGGGRRTRTPNSCVPENSLCSAVPILEESCNEEACPIGTWLWMDWSDCSASCGGGVRTRIPRSCQPRDAICHDIQILEEPCNISSCPDTPSLFLPARV